MRGAAVSGPGVPLPVASKPPIKPAAELMCVLQQPCGSVIAREQARFAPPLRRTVAVKPLAPDAARIIDVLIEPFRSVCSVAAQTCNSLGLQTHLVARSSRMSRKKLEASVPPKPTYPFFGPAALTELTECYCGNCGLCWLRVTFRTGCGLTQ